MTPTNVYVINHTHWDREWFLTSIYTSRWISGLIESLEQLTAENPDFRYLFDGQTLVIEDLLAIAPAYEERVDRLVRSGRLQIGPYYCQPDWQMTGGELLIRNLQFGLQDGKRFGGSAGAGWLVDTFGHISQAPQIHQLFGIEAVYIWRGVPQLTPYFHWQAADDSRVLAINLLGGYRNLYGVSYAPEVAIKRLETEAERLRPYYPTADIPLFDGYDLEDNPEDPLRFYAELNVENSRLKLQESTPVEFAHLIAEKELPLPTISGELNSGKYGATFPGTFSTRTYLKLMAHDCERLLFHRCEPLAVMAALQGRPYPADQFEQWSRQLLQNAIHDCLCGVSIDQVHEKMEYTYRKQFASMNEELQASLGIILSRFPAGDFAVSTNPFIVDQWQIAGNEYVLVQTEGVGVWPINKRLPIEQVNRPVENFHWRNTHYAATLGIDGVLRVGDAQLGQFVVLAEKGDAYSDEAGEQLGILSPTSPLLIMEQSDLHTVLSLSAVWEQGPVQIQARVRIHFDQSPLVQWQIDLDSHGTDFYLEMVFKTARPGQLVAGMPFDVVARPVADNDLLPRQVSDDLAAILLGQRELGKTTTFPFHDFIAVTDESSSIAVLAKGLKAYTAGPNGTIRLPLRRAVEWLTRANLQHRVGDAGPFFYVPDARCERAERNEIAVLFGDFPAGSMQMQQANYAYQNPPLIVRNRGSGSLESWQLFQENMPLSSLTFANQKAVVRLYNPTENNQPLSSRYMQLDVWGNPQTLIQSVPPRKIVNVQLEAQQIGDQTRPADFELVNRPVWRVGQNRGLPAPAVLVDLQAKISKLEEELAGVEGKVGTADGADRLRLLHRLYVLAREQLEYQLSYLLNKRKLAENGALDEAYLFQPDPEIAEVGLKLNKMRIKRRIFDYVVQAL